MNTGILIGYTASSTSTVALKGDCSCNTYVSTLNTKTINYTVLWPLFQSHCLWSYFLTRID